MMLSVDSPTEIDDSEESISPTKKQRLYSSYKLWEINLVQPKYTRSLNFVIKDCLDNIDMNIKDIEIDGDSNLLVLETNPDGGSIVVFNCNNFESDHSRGEIQSILSSFRDPSSICSISGYQFVSLANNDMIYITSKSKESRRLNDLQNMGNETIFDKPSSMIELYPGVLVCNKNFISMIIITGKGLPQQYFRLCTIEKINCSLEPNCVDIALCKENNAIFILDTANECIWYYILGSKESPKKLHTTRTMQLDNPQGICIFKFKTGVKTISILLIANNNSKKILAVRLQAKSSDIIGAPLFGDDFSVVNENDNVNGAKDLNLYPLKITSNQKQKAYVLLGPKSDLRYPKIQIDTTIPKNPLKFDDVGTKEKLDEYLNCYLKDFLMRLKQSPNYAIALDKLQKLEQLVNSPQHKDEFKEDTFPNIGEYRKILAKVKELAPVS